MEVAKTYRETDRILLHTYLWGNCINEKKITALKENAALIRNFGTMYINFDDYLPYSGAMSDFFLSILKPY